MIAKVTVRDFETRFLFLLRSLNAVPSFLFQLGGTPLSVDDRVLFVHLS